MGATPCLGTKVETVELMYIKIEVSWLVERKTKQSINKCQENFRKKNLLAVLSTASH